MAPKFRFLNTQRDKSDKRGLQEEEKMEDEFADIYKEMDILDLTGQELIYIKRQEQLGFFRKKFEN
tara:strand:- start:53 stop:250 length:198 start_codon:yes stop_codon:yes gene_type:complete